MNMIPPLRPTFGTGLRNKSRHEHAEEFPFTIKPATKRKRPPVPAPVREQGNKRHLVDTVV